MSDIFAHICTVCFQPYFEHPERCDCGENHWPPLCCPGCGCGSFEEAHPQGVPADDEQACPA